MPRLLLCLVLLALAAITTQLASSADAGAAQAAPWIGKPIDVVAVGDSYTAGNGADGSASGDEYDGPCFRSAGNYAARFWRGIASTGWYLNRACSNKLIGDVYGQIESLTPTQRSQADLVFVSAGGNDEMFSSIVQDCWTVANSIADCSARLDDAEAMLDDTVTRTGDLLWKLATSFPTARIVFVEYPVLHRVYDDDGNAADDAQRVERLIARHADGVMAQITSKNAQGDVGGRIAFFDRRPVFDGHAVGYSTNWIYGVTDTFVHEERYHPTPDGWAATADAMTDPYGQLHDVLVGLADVPTNLSDRAAGTLVHVEGTSTSWLVDDLLLRHPVLDGGTYECLVAHGHGELTIRAGELAQLGAESTPASDWCFSGSNAAGSIIVDTENKAWLVAKPVVGSITRSWINSPATYRCLVAKGTPVHTGITVDERNSLLAIEPVPNCIDPAEVAGGVVATDPVTHVAYLLELAGSTVTRHEIRSTETYACVAAVHRVASDAYTQNDIVFGTTAGIPVPNCLKGADYVGKLLEDPAQRQMLVTASGQRGVRDGGTSRCLTAWQGREVVHLAAEYLDSLPVDPAGWATCTPPVTVGQILRVSATGASYRVADGTSGGVVLRPIAEAETFRCLVASGASVIDSLTAAHIDAFVMAANEPVCVDRAAYAGKVVRGPGSWTGLVDSSGVIHPITSGGVYQCLVAWGSTPVSAEVFTSAQLAAFATGPSATCNAHAVAAGKIVRTSDGASIFVDSRLIAHRITTAHAYQCLVEVGTQVIDKRTVAHLQAFAYGSDQPGCAKILTSTAGASYFQDTSGTLHALRNASSYYCAADKGYRVQTGLATATIDALPKGSAYPDCLSPKRYLNTIIRRSDGAAWLVNGNGQRRSIPDGHSWSCYTARGIRVAEWSLNSEQAASIPEVGRMPYCLNPASFRNVIVRQSDGVAYKTDGNACRYSVGNGWTYERLIELGVPLAANGLTAEHTASLPWCGTHPYLFSVASFRNVLIRQANGTVWITDGGACRRLVRDWYTVERLQELGYGFKAWTAAQSEVDTLPYCGNQRFLLAKWRVERHVVRGPDGTSWFVSGGEWFWIDSGSKWNWLVNRYGLAGTFSWEHIDSIKWDRGRWAGWW